MTAFRVLSKATTDTGSGWTEHDTNIEAHNAADAVRKAYLKKVDPQVTEMVAVPERSWNPQRIRVEVSQRVVLDDPSALPEPKYPEPAA